MAQRFKLTDVFDGKNSQKMEVKNSISINDTGSLEKMFEVIDDLSENMLSRPAENGGLGLNKDDFIQDTLMMVENGGKFEVKITVI